MRFRNRRVSRGAGTRLGSSCPPHLSPHHRGGLFPSPRGHVLSPRESARDRRTDGEREVSVTFTILHSAADSEIKDLINLGLWVFSRVVPKPNPQASPGARDLETGKAGGAVALKPTPQLCHISCPCGQATPSPVRGRRQEPPPTSVFDDRPTQGPRSPCHCRAHGEHSANVTTVPVDGVPCPQSALLRPLCPESPR